MNDIDVRPLYTKADLSGLSDLDSRPGSPPYIRGTQPTMYTTRPWTIRQYAGFSTAEESNRFYRDALANGLQGISVAFDLPTHRGYDSDHPRVYGDAGKAGVAIDTVEDMKALFSGIDLRKVSVSMTMNGAVLPVMAAYIVAAKEQGCALSELSGTIQNDILKEFLVRNTYIYPPMASMRIVNDVIKFTNSHMPRFNSISISGYHIQEAGADACDELAFTLANGKEYLKQAVAAGMEIDAFAPRLSFFFGVGMHFYLEIAKLRAARLLWCEIVTNFGAKNDRSKALRMHCQTSGWSLSAQDPNNNVVRTTIEAMAAVFGGTQSLHTNSLDEAVSLPTEITARLARNTQLILQEETGITDVIDPWGGSYMMERLTQDVAAKARSVMHDIDHRGGMVATIESGWAKENIERSALSRQAAIDAGEEVIVGVNKYSISNAECTPIRKIDNSAVLREQIRRLEAVKRKRNAAAVEACLEHIRHVASSNGSLLEACIDAVAARATVGEVSAALEDVFGRHTATPGVLIDDYRDGFREKEALCTLDHEMENYTRRYGAVPKILIAKVGQDGHDRGARTVANALSSFGFDVVTTPLFQTALEVVDAAIAHGVNGIGISSLVAAHNDLVPEVTRLLKSKGAQQPVFLGGIIPPQDHDFLKKQGVVAIYGPGTNLVVAARDLLQRLACANDQARATNRSQQGYSEQNHSVFSRYESSKC